MGPSANVDGEIGAVFAGNSAELRRTLRAVVPGGSDKMIARRAWFGVRFDSDKLGRRAATETRRAPERSNRCSTLGYAVVRDHVRAQMTTTVRSGAMYRLPMASTQLAARPSTGPRSNSRI